MLSEPKVPSKNTISNIVDNHIEKDSSFAIKVIFQYMLQIRDTLFTVACFTGIHLYNYLQISILCGNVCLPYVLQVFES